MADRAVGRFSTSGWAPPMTGRADHWTTSVLGEHAFSSQTVVTYYPAPVAVAYRRFCDYENPTDRLLKLVAATEALLRYLVTLGISDLFHCLAASGQQDAALPEHDAFDFLRRPQKMQLGLWSAALGETARTL